MTKVNTSPKSSQLQTGWQSQNIGVISIDTNKHEDLNLVFANHGEEREIYRLTTIEMAEALQKDQELKVYFKQNTETPKGT
jgi:hypothetical protein